MPLMTSQNLSLFLAGVSVGFISAHSLGREATPVKETDWPPAEVCLGSSLSPTTRLTCVQP